MPSESPESEAITTIDVAPSGRIVETLARREAIPSVMEQVDNAIDAARRHNQFFAENVDEQIQNPEIEIEYVSGEEESYIEIFDTCGGLSKEHLSAVLRPGVSSADIGEEVPILADAIGWAGVGAIRGAMSLGHTVTFNSRRKGEEQGYGATVTLENYTTDDTEIPLRPVDMEKDGSSVMRIEDLVIDLEDDFGENGQKLVKELASTYSLFLGGEFPGLSDEDGLNPEINLEIYVNGESIRDHVTAKDYDWAYIPMDNLFPRTIRNYRVYPDKFEEEGVTGNLRVDFTVGLLREKKSNQMGLTLYANRRKILDAETSKGIERKFNFNKFNTITQGRLCVLVSIRSIEQPQDIPTTDEKDTLNFDYPESKEILEAVGRLGIEYQRQSTSTKLPVPITRAYPAGHPQAGNGGVIESHWYEDSRKNITDKPGEPGSGRYNDFVEYPYVRDTIKAHAKLGIWCPSALSPKFRPAYEGIPEEMANEYGLSTTKGYYQNQFEELHGDAYYLDESVTVDEGPPDEYDIEERTKTIRDLARLHAREGVYSTSLPDYEIPYYEEQLVTAGADLEELEEIDELTDDYQVEPLDEDAGDTAPDVEGVFSESTVNDSLGESRVEIEQRYLPEGTPLSEIDEEDALELIKSMWNDNQRIQSKLSQFVEELEEEISPE